MNQFSDVVFKCIVVVGTMTDLHCKLEEIVPNEKGFSRNISHSFTFKTQFDDDTFTSSLGTGLCTYFKRATRLNNLENGWTACIIRLNKVTKDPFFANGLIKSWKNSFGLWWTHHITQ